MPPLWLDVMIFRRHQPAVSCPIVHELNAIENAADTTVSYAMRCASGLVCHLLYIFKGAATEKRVKATIFNVQYVRCNNNRAKKRRAPGQQLL